jgi:hypothetical protein
MVAGLDLVALIEGPDSQLHSKRMIGGKTVYKAGCKPDPYVRFEPDGLWLSANPAVRSVCIIE